MKYAMSGSGVVPIFFKSINLYSSPIISSPYPSIKLILNKMLKLLQFDITLENASQHYKSSLFVFSQKLKKHSCCFHMAKLALSAI